MAAKQIHFKDRASWRRWLTRNHESSGILWLVFYKKHTGVRTISYDAAVEEALCFGWIDSLVKRLDVDRFMRKFTPRTNTHNWSESNLERVEKLKAKGLMMPVGLAKIEPTAKTGPDRRKTPLEIPAYFQEALARDDQARLFFNQLALSYRRGFVLWVDSAKREETRIKRLAEALLLLRQNQKLGMK